MVLSMIFDFEKMTERKILRRKRAETKKLCEWLLFIVAAFGKILKLQLGKFLGLFILETNIVLLIKCLLLFQNSGSCINDIRKFFRIFYSIPPPSSLPTVLPFAFYPPLCRHFLSPPSPGSHFPFSVLKGDSIGKLSWRPLESERQQNSAVPTSSSKLNFDSWYDLLLSQQTHIYDAFIEFYI